MRILLVDDEPLNLELLDAHLDGLGHELLHARTGEEALLHVVSARPDLVLLDVMMPGIGGLETVKRIKTSAAERAEYLPVILVTALHDATSRQRGLEQGADDFLSKPIDAVELKLRIANLLALRADRLALQARNRRLELLQAFKDELVAIIVHDLKNPAAVVLANVEFAISSVPAALGASTLSESLDDARDGCRRLLRLLANLLDVARSEDDQLSPRRTPVALSMVIEPIVALRQSAAQSRRLQLEVQLAPETAAPVDADLVARIIESVLDNAMRYTPAGGTIQLRTQQVDGFVQVRIGNTGPAILPEHRLTIFEKYGQGTTAGKPPRDGGLGLYFCRLAAEAHGGRIWIEEEGALPTVFVVALPAAETRVSQ